MSLYDDLGVAPEASSAEIKSAFRKLAQKHHPDKEGGDHEKMQVIQHAYDVLSDQMKRDYYDRTGQDGGVPDHKAQAISFIAGMFSELIAGDLYGNIIEQCRNGVTDKGREVDVALKKINSQAEKLDRNRKRVISKSGGHNIFAMVLEAKLNEAMGHINTLEERKKVLQECHLLLDDHEDTQPQQPNFVTPNQTLIDAILGGRRSAFVTGGS